MVIDSYAKNQDNEIHYQQTQVSFWTSHYRQCDWFFAKNYLGVDSMKYSRKGKTLEEYCYFQQEKVKSKR